MKAGTLILLVIGAFVAYKLYEGPAVIGTDGTPVSNSPGNQSNNNILVASGQTLAVFNAVQNRINQLISASLGGTDLQYMTGIKGETQTQAQTNIFNNMAQYSFPGTYIGNRTDYTYNGLSNWGVVSDPGNSKGGTGSGVGTDYVNYLNSAVKMAGDISKIL
jgi:hypothetical protein